MSAPNEAICRHSECGGWSPIDGEDLAELRRRAARATSAPPPPHGLFVAQNDRTPAGWVEIQRDDNPDVVDEPIFRNDAHAARMVAEAGGAPGTACLYLLEVGALVQLEVGAEDDWSVAPLEEARDALERVAEELEGVATWILVVPVVVARAAGLP